MGAANRILEIDGKLERFRVVIDIPQFDCCFFVRPSKFRLEFFIVQLPPCHGLSQLFGPEFRVGRALHGDADFFIRPAP